MWQAWSPSIAILGRLPRIAFNCTVYRSVSVFALFYMVVMPAFGQVSVLTQHNDNARTGQNTSETILTAANVNTSQFGKLFALPVDGQVYAQPLYVAGVTINGGVHNVVIVATENDSVYAFDADSTSAVLLWNTKASLVDAAHGAGASETAASSAVIGCSDLQPSIGITSTPVIDLASKTIYVEAKSTNGVKYFHRLHALDLLTGNEKAPGPVVIAATVSGTGDGSTNGQLAFEDLYEMNRPGLLLLNGTIYLAYASHCDGGPYHGWLFAYDEGTFAKKSVYVTTPNGGLGGFWMSGAGVAADGSGNIFIASGNGDFDTTNVPAKETSDTLLKLGTTNQILTQLDYFTPHDQASLQSGDEDLGSGGIVLLPDQPGTFPHILVEAGKEGRVYVINRDQMTTNNSHYCSGCANDPEIIEESGNGTVGCCGVAMFNVPTYWNNNLYFWGAQDVLRSIPITNGLPDFTHITASTPYITFPGAGTSVSSNGTTAGIVWAIDSSQYKTPGPAVLYAFDATNVRSILYSSGQNATRDAAGNAVKFAVPTIANGKVYVGTSNAVDVYGLLGANLPNISSISPSSALAGGAAFPLTVNGIGFVSASVVKFNGAAKTTTFVSAAQLTAAITAADIATAGTATVTVTNPGSGGTSNAVSFTINAASAPTLTSLAPTSATVGGAAFTLTLTGTGFVAGATVNFGSSPAITPSSVTSTQVVATIPAADIAAGTVNVTVTNPAGGGTSNAQTFTINNPAATATSLSPTSTTVGGTAFTLTVNGTGFVSTSVVKFNGAAKTTTFVGATQLTAAITAADIATAGTATVTVTNPAPGGGTSGNLSFTINGASAPALTSVAPATATVGGAGFALTMSGTGFVAGATVNFGTGPAITPSSVTSTQIVATIPAADIATAGTVNVTVTNPAGGGTSNAQTFTINNPAPTATSLSPTSATAGGAAFTLTVNGIGFVSASVVKFNGAAKSTTFVTATQLSAAITAADIATAGTATVTVTNPAPGGGPSGNLSFTINAASAPTLTSLTPNSATAAGGAFTLTLTGTGFVAGATVNFGGNPAITPSSVTSTQIVASIPAADIATGGTANVTVTNPPPGGGISSAQTFTINNPAPTTSSLSPTSATAGGAGFPLTVNGTGFVSGSIVKFNGVAKATSFVGSTQITAAITAADIATAGPVSVTVTNPAPSGGTSNAQTFTINSTSNLTITSLSPASATAGSAGFTLTVNGTGFVSGATVQFNGANRTTTFVSGTQVTAAILAADIATAGTASVTVTNPAPSGGTSNAQTFTINSTSNLTITSLSPSSTTAGGAAFTLTVNGTGFVSGAVVKFGGVAKTTTFTSATQLTAAIAAADIASGGVQSITVTNPAPGGGTSNAATFTVNNTVPTLSSLSPSSVFAGSGAFTLTVNGTGFVNGASVQFNGASRTTTFVSSTQLTAAILASDIAAAGTANVTVTNPSPTTGPSASLALNISNENNPVPAISALDTTHVTGGAAFTLTVNGSNFEQKSVVNLNGKAEATTFVSTTRISAAIPASDVAVAGSVNVTVTNPPPGGGTSSALAFFVDGYTVGGSSTASVASGQSAMLQITVTPTANGFSNQVAFSISGLPSGVSALFAPASVTPGGKAATTMLTITDGGAAASRAKSQAGISGGGIAPTLLFGVMVLVACLGFETRGRSIPEMRHYATVGLFVFMLIAGSVLGGCALGVTSSPSSQTSQLTVTATSGTMTQTFGITLTVTK